MAIRTSQGKHLQVLTPSALVNLPLEFDVYDGANPASMLATIEAAFDGAYQSQMSEVGSGRFSLLRSDPKATAAILAKGNLVRVKTGGINRGSWWIEEPTERLTSTQEAAGEIVQVKGRGALAYLERGTVYPPVWPAEPVGFRSASSGSNTLLGATTVVCAKPSGMVNTDTMIAAVAFAGGSDKAITPPLGWREIRRVDEGTGLGIALYRKSVGSSEPANYSWAFTTSTKAVVNIVALFNASPDYTVYGFDSASAGSGTAILHPSLAVEVVDGMLLTFAGSTAGSGMTPPGGYTEAVDNHTVAGRSLESAYSAWPALGDTGEKTATNTASGTWIGLHVFIPSTASNDAAFTGETPGAILGTLIDRAQARGALPVLTYDFTATADSLGVPWPDTFDLTFHAGTSLLDVWRQLVALGTEGLMSHDLRLSAYVALSRDKASDVILRKGYHFLGDVENNGHFAGLRTRFLVEGAGGRLVEVTNPALEADAKIGRREGFLSMATSDSATDLQRAGEQALALSALEDESRSIPVDHGLLTEGRYEPWEEYRIGDYIGLDADGTGIVSTERIVGITVSHKGALDYGVELDLNSVSLEASVRMRRQLDALARSSSSGGSGSYGLSLGGSGGGGGGAGSGTVAVAAGDTLAYLLDKIDARGILRKTLGGVPGNRTVQLDAVITPADLGSGTPGTGTFLRGDAVWAAPAGSTGYPPESPDEPSATPDAMDDHFLGGSLDGKWTIWNQQAGQLVRVGSSHLNLWSPYTIQARVLAAMQPAPSGTWRVRFKTMLDAPTWNYMSIGGIVRRLSGTDYSVAAHLGYYANQQGTFYSERLTGVAYRDSETDLYNFQFPCYIEIEYNGTYVIFRASGVGDYFSEVQRFTASTDLGGAPTHVGMNCRPWGDGNSKWMGSASFDWFRRMA